MLLYNVHFICDTELFTINNKKLISLLSVTVPSSDFSNNFIFLSLPNYT